jgi:hypothetical protein
LGAAAAELPQATQPTIARTLAYATHAQCAGRPAQADPSPGAKTPARVATQNPLRQPTAPALTTNNPARGSAATTLRRRQQAQTIPRAGALRPPTAPTAGTNNPARGSAVTTLRRRQQAQCSCKRRCNAVVSPLKAADTVARNVIETYAHDLCVPLGGAHSTAPHASPRARVRRGCCAARCAVTFT